MMRPTALGTAGTFVRVLSSAVDVLRMLGGRRMLLEMIPWLLRRCYYLYAMVPTAAAPPVSCPVPFRLEIVREEDIPHIVALRPGFYTEAQLRARLLQGHLGFVGRSGDAIVHLRWVFVGTCYVPYLARWIVLAPGEGYLDEVYTVPQWRQKRIGIAAAFAMQQMLHARGFTRISCAIATWNRWPQRIAQLQGYVRVETVEWWALPGVQRIFGSAVSDRANLH